MGFWDLLPLALGGVVLYITSAWLAGFVIRKRNEPIVSDHERGITNDRDRRGKARTGNMLRSYRSLEPAPDRRKSEAIARAKTSSSKGKGDTTGPATTGTPIPVATKPKQRIESLDFTLLERNRARSGLGPAVELASGNLPIMPPVIQPSEADELGQTLVLDTAELMKAIGGKPPPPPPPVAPMTESTEATPDWTAALNGVKGFGEESTTSFFAAPQAGVPALDLTQPVRLNASGTLLPEDDDTLRRIAQSIPVNAGPDPTVAPVAPAPQAEEAVSPVTADDEFRRVAIAHDDIQSARIAFEALAVHERKYADPIYRAMVFGACAAYARPFMQKSDGTSLLDTEWWSFPRRDHNALHRELLELRCALLDGASTADDEIVSLEGADGDASFAIRSTAFNDGRVPAYVGLCADLEARLLDRLSVLAEPAMTNEVGEREAATA